MGTTQQKLAYLSNAVSDIKSAIESRGVVVGDAPLGQYFLKIEEIPSDNIASVVDKSVTEITADMLESATEIGDYTFYGCTDLTVVHIPATVTSIGDYAFYGCSSLATIYFHGAQWSSVTKGTNWDGNTGVYSVICGSIGLSFISNGDGTCYVSGIGTCTDTDIIIPDVSPDGDSVTGIGDEAFSDCSGLTSVTIPNSVTGIGNYAFSGCSGLTSVTIPDSVTSIGDYAFQSCSGLSSVTIPNVVTSIGEGTFLSCSGLTSVTIGNGVTSIGEHAFGLCSKLTSVTIPNSVMSIGKWAFSSCSGLTSVTIPNSVTSLGGSAFNSCSGLTSVTIGDGVTSIGQNAFFRCSGLNSATVLSTTPPSLGDTNSFSGAYPIYVPSESVDLYKEASVWSNLADRIQAIPT